MLQFESELDGATCRNGWGYISERLRFLCESKPSMQSSLNLENLDLSLKKTTNQNFSHPLRFQQNDATRDHVSGPDRLCIEYTVVVTWNKDAQPGRDGGVPSKEVLQVGRVESLTGISGTDEDIGINRHFKAQIHPVSIGEGKDLMTVVVDEHLIS